MNKLVFQRNIFHENDDEHIEAISKYFDVIELEDQYTTAAWHNHICGRYSIAAAKMFGKFEKFTNALLWAGKLRDEMVSPYFHFQTLFYLTQDPEEVYWTHPEKQLFIRPTSGDKVFAGDVFTRKKLKNEFDFLMQRNVDLHTLCLVTEPVNIGSEYRLIFIDSKYVSGSKYMDNGEFSVCSSVPDTVVNYGKLVHKHCGLPPWVVLDVGIKDGEPRVIEINQLETSSFYAADLDKIYKTWAGYYRPVTST